MKIKYLKIANDEVLIKKVLLGEAHAERLLYEKYAAYILGVCRRYVANFHDAEDVALIVLQKVFERLDQYKFEGDFQAWIRKVAVNESLMYLRSKKNWMTEISDDLPVPCLKPNAYDQLTANDLLDLLDHLPTGYKTVFNLYVIEGFKHREIADLLGISINTSKSQLILARKKLSEMIVKNSNTHGGEI
jgi:RNA polymerase sigma-70 factor (ECF subfamily)